MSAAKELGALLDSLQLEVITGNSRPDIRPSNNLPWFSPLNPLSPAVIQVIGPAQLQQLATLSHDTQCEIYNHIRQAGAQLVILTDKLQTPDSFLSDQTQSPLCITATSQTFSRVLACLDQGIAHTRSEVTYRHGVFLDVLGCGVLITGSSNIGKSELALELISRGHSLIADDAPEFSLSPLDTVIGVAPEILREFLEVRGLGVVNVRAMFGDNAVKHHKTLRLIIHLRQYEHSDEITMDRLYGSSHQQEILEQLIDTIELPVAPGRNLAVLVETAVRNYNLKLKGYNSANEFIKRQQSFLDSDTE